MTPKVSIIIPVYNAASYIERCVQSILLQDVKNRELILVDDGSKDNSGAICNTIAAEHDNVQVIHQPNGGVSSARNTGLDHATGEWIAFVDADDQVPPDALGQFEKALESNPEADYHTFNIRTTGLDGIVTSFSYSDCVLTPEELLSKILKYEICVGPVAKLFRKSTIDKLGLRFNTNLRIGEDLVFNLDYIINSNATCIMHSGVVYAYLQNEGSAMFARDNTADYDKLNTILCNYKNTPLLDNADINFCIATNLITNTINQKRYFGRSLSKQLQELNPVTDNGSYTNKYLNLLRMSRWVANARLAVSYFHHRKD